MPSKMRRRKDYNLVDDGHDARIPMHNEEAFKHGIHFKSKYIGTLDVPRPTGRMEIVVAMRRIRYEFKAKAIKKKKVDVVVGVDGVKVTQRKKKKKKQMWAWDMDRLNIMNDPVYRIFYVSHDSHDLKIWSYIARDGQSNVFRCNVFKSPKKSQAMQVVRTIGQAFEVSHKLSAMISPKKEPNKDEIDEAVQTEADGEESKKTETTEDIKDEEESPTTAISNEETSLKPTDISLVTGTGALSTHHTIQLLQQKLQQTEQQAQVAMAQVHLLKDQLSAESTARIESQARNHQLLIQNKEQIEQMSKLVERISKLEKILNEKLPDGVDSFSILQESGDITSNEMLLDVSTPAPGPVHIPALADIDMSKDSPFMDIGLFANTNTTTTTNEPLTNGHLTITPTTSSEISHKIMDDSSSSSSEDEGYSKKTAPTQHWPHLQLLNNNSNQTKDTINNTSVWTSGALTPDNKLHTMSDNNTQSISNDLTLSLDNSDANLTNGYTLSPIMDSSNDGGSSSLFRHFSLLDSEDPPHFDALKSMDDSSSNVSSRNNVIRWNKPNSPTKTSPEKQLPTNSSLSLISPPVPSPRNLKASPSDPAFRHRPAPKLTPGAAEMKNQENVVERKTSHKNPFKDFEHKELTKSLSFPSAQQKIFSSAEQFNTSLKYEPIRKEIAAEHTENLLSNRLNSSFSVSESSKIRNAESLNKSYSALTNGNGLDAPVLKSSSAFSPDFSAIMDFSMQESSFENSKNELFIDEESLKSSEGKSEKQPYAQLIKTNSESSSKGNFFHQPIGSEFYKSKNSMDDSSGSSPDDYSKTQSSGFDSGVADETGSDSMKN